MMMSMWHRMERTQQVYHLSEQLIRAIGRGMEEEREAIIVNLIELGADVNLTHGTLLPLHYACCLGDQKILQLLIDRGANLNLSDGYQRTALHYASEQINERCVRILLQSGAHPDQPDGNGNTALHWAAYKNNTACVDTLLQLGACVNATDYNKETPLCWAAQKGNLSVVRVLLNYNADVNIRNHRGQSPLEKSMALQVTGLNNSEDDQCLQLLIQASGQIRISYSSTASASSQSLISPPSTTTTTTLTSVSNTNTNNTATTNTSTRGSLLHPVYVVLRGDNRPSSILPPSLVDSPRPLMELTRHAVRQSMQCSYLPDTVLTLPLPPKLQQYLLLSYSY